MPLRSLTPLGRQLRSVLATIRPLAAYADTIYLPSTSATNHNRARIGHGLHKRRYVWAEAVAVLPESPPASKHEAHDGERKTSNRSIKRQTRVSRVTEALRNSGQRAVLPAAFESSIDLSHYNVRQRGGRLKHSKNALHRLKNSITSLVQTKEVTLEKILASHIYHRSCVQEGHLAEWTAPFRVTGAEQALLEAKGFDLNDVAAWDAIITSSSSLGAAQALADRTASQDVSSVPLFVLLYLLRRPYVSASALRVITNQAWLLFNSRMSSNQTPNLPVNAVFLVFVRLLRHAREVLPAAMENITAILLHFIPKAISSGEKLTVTQLETLTFMLNKAMRLIALRTAIQPFKNNRFQELALISVLRFMAEHSPPLQTNREGYRAVISVQLTQRKTKKERQWAELKGLSWPPWKQERTAMDFDITADDHGVSKARETLLRMQEAGYGHHEWEKVASIYAGWDIDGTPTIQTRVLFEASATSLRLGTAAWAARINTTRTAQEAWACYLAYEDSTSPSDQDVYLAIFQKLSQEEKRKREALLSTKEGSSDEQRQWYPGDRKEVKPLPPSTHLHTYTRTPPPTVHGLYTTLRERGIAFSSHCLAFLIANARSLQDGHEYLRHGVQVYPQLSKVLGQHLLDHSSADIPIHVFEAIIALLTRFPNDFAQLTSSQTPRAPGEAISSLRLGNHKLNSNHALVRAFELVHQRRPTARPAWNAILNALARETPIIGLYSSPMANTPFDVECRVGEDDRSRSAILAYRLTRKLLALMRHSHLDLDAVGFRALCQVTENMTVACWKTLKHSSLPGHADVSPFAREAVRVMQSCSNTQRLTAAFRELVGSDSVVRPRGGDHRMELHDAWRIPSALERLGPAVLHSYIRALGWMADYHGVLETVRWMARYKHELNENFKVDWNGEIMTRRLMTAIRVFLERSWLSLMALEEAKDHSDQPSVKAPTQAVLESLRQPADPSVIDETRALMESVEDWGGWPEDDEVDEYCRHQRFSDTQ